MSGISESLRQQVLDRAYGLCEYCQTAKIVVTRMEIDHIIPLSAGGLSTFDNLCLSCPTCNNAKRDNQVGADPETGETVALFNPRLQTWSEHFKWSEDSLLVLGLTAVGRATVQRLKMNGADVVASRALWAEAGWHPPKSKQFPNI